MCQWVDIYSLVVANYRVFKRFDSRQSVTLHGFTKLRLLPWTIGFVDDEKFSNDDSYSRKQFSDNLMLVLCLKDFLLLFLIKFSEILQWLWRKYFFSTWSNSAWCSIYIQIDVLLYPYSIFWETDLSNTIQFIITVISF